MNFVVFYFAPWLLLMHDLKIYSNLPIMCKLDCIAEIFKIPNNVRLRHIYFPLYPCNEFIKPFMLTYAPLEYKKSVPDQVGQNLSNP